MGKKTRAKKKKRFLRLVFCTILRSNEEESPASSYEMAEGARAIGIGIEMLKEGGERAKKCLLLLFGFSVAALVDEQNEVKVKNFPHFFPLALSLPLEEKKLDKTCLSPRR